MMLFKDWFSSLKSKEDIDFKYAIYRENLWKFVTIGLIFMFVEIGVAYYLPHLWSKRVNVFRIYIIVYLLIVLPLMIRIYQKYDTLWKYAVPAIDITTFVVLFWAAQISLYYQEQTNHIMIYIVALLVLGNIVVINQRTKTFIYSLVQFFFMVQIGHYVQEKQMLVTYYINSNLVVVFSIILSGYIRSLRVNLHQQLVKIEMQNMELKQLSIKDSMTGLYNHQCIHEYLEKEVTKAQRYKTKLSIAMFDIDHFKRVNDEYGHVFGDEVIISIVEILLYYSRESDYIGRYGGEEFMIILPNTSLEDAKEQSERLRRFIENFEFKNGLRITISGGVAEWDGKTPEALVLEADNLLYKAKKRGRNQIAYE